MARLWHTVILSKWKLVFEYITLESQIEKFQDGYYKAIAMSHLNGNSTCFVEFILEQINLVLEEIRGQSGHPDESISKYVKRLLEAMEYDTAYTAGEVLKLLNLKSKDNK